MRLVEKLVPRSYHLLDYDWTPLSQNPYWIAVLLTASIVTWRDTGVFRQASEQSAVVQILPGTRISFPGSGGDTSFADDLVASRYCKCWEWACLTIHWDFTWVLMMCQNTTTPPFFMVDGVFCIPKSFAFGVQKNAVRLFPGKKSLPLPSCWIRHWKFGS